MAFDPATSRTAASCADAVNLGEDPSLGVLCHDGFGLLVVPVQSATDDGFVVVAPAGFLGPAEQPMNEFLVG